MVIIILAQIHNKHNFPTVVENIYIAPYGTVEMDLPEDYKYNSKKISVTYLKNATDIEIKKEVVETPKPKRRKRSATTTNN